MPSAIIGSTASQLGPVQLNCGRWRRLKKTKTDSGTSASTPLWASLAAQVNAIFNDQGLPNLGYANDAAFQSDAKNITFSVGSDVTTMVADISSRSARLSSRGGIGVSQMSASRPT